MRRTVVCDQCGKTTQWPAWSACTPEEMRAQGGRHHCDACLGDGTREIEMHETGRRIAREHRRAHATPDKER